ncbi:hypothetical protein ACX80V_08370 [Arthrobacter sp. MDT3-24]
MVAVVCDHWSQQLVGGRTGAAAGKLEAGDIVPVGQAQATATEGQGVFVTAWVAIALVYIALNWKKPHLVPDIRPAKLKAVSPGAIAWVYYGAYKLSPPQFIDASQTLDAKEEELDPAITD